MLRLVAAALLAALAPVTSQSHTYRDIVADGGSVGQCALASMRDNGATTDPNSDQVKYCCEYNDASLLTQQDCEDKCNSEAICVAYSWKVSYTDCAMWDAVALPDTSLVVGARSLTAPNNGHYDASCYVKIPMPPASPPFPREATATVGDDP